MYLIEIIGEACFIAVSITGLIFLLYIGMKAFGAYSLQKLIEHEDEEED